MPEAPALRLPHPAPADVLAAGDLDPVTIEPRTCARVLDALLLPRTEQRRELTRLAASDPGLTIVVLRAVLDGGHARTPRRPSGHVGVAIEWLDAQGRMTSTFAAVVRQRDRRWALTDERLWARARARAAVARRIALGQPESDPAVAATVAVLADVALASLGLPAGPPTRPIDLAALTECMAASWGWTGPEAEALACFRNPGSATRGQRLAWTVHVADVLAPMVLLWCGPDAWRRLRPGWREATGLDRGVLGRFMLEARLELDRHERALEQPTRVRRVG